MPAVAKRQIPPGEKAWPERRTPPVLRWTDSTEPNIVAWISRRRPEKPVVETTEPGTDSDLDAPLQEARGHHGAGRYAEAERIYRQILDRRPDDAEVMSKLGAALAAQGRLDEMLSVLQRAVELDPDLVEAHNNLGAAFRLQGRLEDAVAALRRALAINPDHVSAHVNLGAALQGLGRIDDAVASYRKAIAIKPDLVATQVKLGEVRPLLDDTLDFEKAFSENAGIDSAELKHRGTYRLLRASLVDRWNVLDEFKNYPHMLTPLEILEE